MTSLIQIAYRSRVLRHGRSRAARRNQARMRLASELRQDGVTANGLRGGAFTTCLVRVVFLGRRMHGFCFYAKRAFFGSAVGPTICDHLFTNRLCSVCIGPRAESFLIFAARCMSSAGARVGADGSMRERHEELLRRV